MISAAANQSGEKLFSEYDGQWKSGDHQERIVFKDILLPPNAPKAYADRQTLWNALDASEEKDNAQTARRFIITLPKELSIEENIKLIRDYCQKQFVDRGIIADIAVHFDDKEPPNPHAHILCTMRSMNEHGEWNDKTKTAYALDENGNRIMGKNGKWKRIRMDTVDWNDRKYEFMVDSYICAVLNLTLLDSIFRHNSKSEAWYMICWIRIILVLNMVGIHFAEKYSEYEILKRIQERLNYCRMLFKNSQEYIFEEINKARANTSKVGEEKQSGIQEQKELPV